jgi:phosphohistidine phosphatase
MSTLFIIRHAYAGQHGDPRYPDDSLRPLTPEGVKQFRKAVKKLVERGLEVDIVASSPLVRCRQTAEIVCASQEPKPELVELEALEPGSDLAALIEWSNGQPHERLAWVGHAPDVDRLTGALLGAPAYAFSFRKGAIARIDFEAEIDSGAGELRYFLAPTELGCRRSD